MVNAFQELSDENEKLQTALEDAEQSNLNLAAENKDILARLGEIEKKLGIMASKVEVNE